MLKPLRFVGLLAPLAVLLILPGCGSGGGHPGGGSPRGCM